MLPRSKSFSLGEVSEPTQIMLIKEQKKGRKRDIYAENWRNKAHI